MRSFLTIAAILAFAAPAAQAQFTVTASGGSINDNDVQFFPLFFSDGGHTVPQDISVISLEVAGLTHPRPGDLNIYLVDPFGNEVEVMDDQGDALAVENVTLTFNDTAVDPLPAMDQIVSGEYAPVAGAFSSFTNSGVNAWLLVVIDDAEDNMGTAKFDDFTITFVPEPMSLSLLGVGAVALLRRRRR